MRWWLIDIGERGRWFVWTNHHLLLDGWSYAAVLGEVLACYEALVTGGEPRLLKRRPYREHIAWLESHDSESSKAYWRSAFAGWSGPETLGLERWQGESAVPQVRQIQEALGIGTLQEQARRHQLTLNTVVQGAWALLLREAGGRPDVTFGTTVSGRTVDLPGIESMVGLLINTLPVRLDVHGEQRLLPWLLRLQQEQAELRRHEHTPPAKIREWIGLESGQPLFASTLVFENYPRDRSMRQRGASLEVTEVHTQEQSHHPLAVTVIPGDEELLLRFELDDSRLDAAAAERLLGRFRNLLEILVIHLQEGGGIRLSDLLLSDLENVGPELRPWASKD